MNSFQDILAAKRVNRRRFLGGAATLAALPAFLPADSRAAATSRLVVGVHQDMPVTDAQKSRAMVEHMVMKHVVENLVTFDEDNKPVPQLAESWTIENGGAKYVFKLRQGVKFHDGSDFDAEAVKYSIERLKKVSPSSGDYSDIIEVNIRDPHTVEMVLTAPSPILPSVLAGPFGGYIMPKGIAESQGGEVSKPIGTGPFEWGEYQPGRLLRIRKAKNFTPDTNYPGPTGLGGRREAMFDEIEFRVVPEGSSRVTGLETDELGFSLLLKLSDFDSLSGNPMAVQIEEPSFESLVIWLGVNQAPTNDLRFRQAVSHAINYDLLVQAAVAGHGAANNAFLHPELRSWYSPPMSRRHEFNVETAKKLLAQTSYKGEPLTVHVSNSTEYSLNAALVLQQMLAAVGIVLKVNPLDSAGVMSIVYAKQPSYNFGITSISGRMDPDQVYFRRLHSSVAVNGYKNPAYDAVVEKARSSMDHEERVKLYADAQNIVMDDVPAIVLFNVNFLNAASKKIKGYKPNALGLPRFWNVSAGSA
jgi:peptide/nickel transport system substrate-binding protein